MEDLQPGLIVSVSGLHGMYVVLTIDASQARAVLFSRDGRKRILRDMPTSTLEIIPGQMLAWIDRMNWCASDRKAERRAAVNAHVRAGCEQDREQLAADATSRTRSEHPYS